MTELQANPPSAPAAPSRPATNRPDADRARREQVLSEVRALRAALPPQQPAPAPVGRTQLDPGQPLLTDPARERTVQPTETLGTAPARDSHVPTPPASGVEQLLAAPAAGLTAPPRAPEDFPVVDDRTRLSVTDDVAGTPDAGDGTVDPQSTGYDTGGNPMARGPLEQWRAGSHVRGEAGLRLLLHAASAAAGIGANARATRREEQANLRQAATELGRTNPLSRAWGELTDMVNAVTAMEEDQLARKQAGEKVHYVSDLRSAVADDRDARDYKKVTGHARPTSRPQPMPSTAADPDVAPQR